MSKKILLDTDIGSDIDDAVCLAYLLTNPECELMGITTVTGDAERRAKLASVLCKMAGKDVPIFPGLESPLILPQSQKIAEQAEAINKWPHEKEFPQGEAIEFMRRTIRKYPGEVTLLTVAPLTNVGLLFKIDPEIPHLLNSLVMMCGRFIKKIPEFGPLEWNASGDAHATAIVYKATVPLHRSVGLDVTHQVEMSTAEFQETYKHDIFQPVIDMGKTWFKKWGGTTFHDPLAAVTIFHEEVCQYQKGTVEIELYKKDLAGFTRWIPGDSESPHEIATSVNPVLFFKKFNSVFK